MEFDITTAQPVQKAKGTELREEFDITTAQPIPDAEPIPVDEEDLKSTGIGTDLLRVTADTLENINPINLYMTGRILTEDIKGALGFESDAEVMEKEAQAVKQAFNKFSPDALNTMIRAFDMEEDIYTPEGEVKETETTVGNIASIIPYALGGAKVYKKLGEGGSKFFRGLKAGAITDAVLSDPNDGTITDAIVEAFPGAGNNIIVDLVTTKEDSTTLEKKAKLVFEGMAIGTVVDLAVGFVTVGKKVFGKKPETSLQELTEKSEELYKKPFEELDPTESADVMVKVLKEAKVNATGRTGTLPDDPNIKLTETPEGSVQVAVQNSNALMRFMRRFFTSRGYFTPRGYNAFQDSQYAQRQTIARAENIALRLQKSIDAIGEGTEKAEVIETINKLFTEDLRYLNNLDSQKDRIVELADRYDLTDEMAEEFLNARQLIDSLSKELIDSPSVSDGLKETITENVGEYVRRSYRLYEDAGYKPTPEVQKEATNYIYKNILDNDPNISEEFAYQKAKDAVDEILASGDSSEFSDYFTNVKKVNTDILKQKGSIAPEIRALMGEITEPSENIILTVSKMTNLVETSKFYTNLESLGHSGGYIFKEGQARPAGYDAKITGTNSSLDGQYTTKEILDEIRGNTSHLMQGAKLSNWYKNFLSLKGTSQKLKTVFSHVTHLRNFLGGMQFGIANGVNPFKTGTETFKVLRDSVRKGGDKELNALYEKYLRLGIINTNVRVNEFRAILDTGAETKADQFTTKLAERLKLDKAARTIEDVYMATDDYYKINVYNQELDTLKKAYPDVEIEVLEEQAANIVRNTLPNYDRVPKGVKGLRELPLGSFFSFPAEIIRTSYHITKQGALETLSSNPTIRKRGAKRLAGFTVTTVGFDALSTHTGNMAGFGEEEQKAIAILTETPWSKTAPRNIVSFDGKIYTNDTQFLDSYSPLKEPFRAAADALSKGEINETEFDERILDATLEFSYAFFKPYIEEPILTAAITDVGLAALNANGRTPDGKEIFTAGLTTGEKTANVFEHLVKTIYPGSVVSAESLGKAMFETPDKNTGKLKNKWTELAANMTGIKFVELDVETQLKYSINDYKKNNALMIATGINYEREYSEIEARYKNQQKARLENYRNLYRKVEAAKVLVGRNQTVQYLMDNGLSKDDITALLEGRFRPTEPPETTFIDLLEKTPDVTTPKDAVEKNKKLMKIYFDLADMYLNNPIKVAPVDDNERLKKVMGGQVSRIVPNAPINPSERVNKVTGVPYNLEAGTAFLEETNPLRSLLMAKGGRVKYYEGGEAFAARFVGLSEEDIDFARSQDKRYPKNEELDGRGDAARHLALGWITQRAKNPSLALAAANFRENLSLTRKDKPMDVHNNNLGATMTSKTYEEAEKEIDRLISEKKAMFMTPKESAEMRGYAKGGKVLETLKNNEREKFSRGKLVKEVIEFFAPKKESGMYSAAEKASQKLEGSKPREGQAFLNEIKKDPNVTEEELTWTGANEKFANNTKVTKEEVQDFFKENDFDYDVYVGKHEQMKGGVYDDDTPIDNIQDDWMEADDDELFDKWMQENYPQQHTMMEEVLERDTDAWYDMHENFWDEWENSRSFTNLSGKDFTTNPAHIHFSFEGEDTVNYREMVLALPEKFKKVERDYEHPIHFKGIKNPILHIRFADIEEVKSPNTKTLLIDEIQSDKSTAGKEHGYAFSNDEYIIPNQEAIKNLDKEYDTLVEEMEDLEEILEGMTNTQLASERGKRITSELESVKNKMKENAEATEILKDEAEEFEFPIPTLPLKKEKNWATVGLRKALITAAEEGYDQVALTTGRIQALRNAKIGDINEAILYKRDDGWSLQGVSTSDELDDFIVNFDTYEEAVAKLPKIIGKQNADELLASTPDAAGDYSLKKSMTFEKGGKKFYEFYDKSLPKILNKQFGKKYGVEIKMVKYKQKDKTVELPTLKITDKMREDILKGLKMFVEGGLVEET